MTSDFCPNSFFPTVDFELAAYTNSKGDFQLYIQVNNLFKVEAKPENIEALKYIHQSRRHPWPLDWLPQNSEQSEKDMMLKVSSEILVLFLWRSDPGPGEVSGSSNDGWAKVW